MMASDKPPSPKIAVMNINPENIESCIKETIHGVKENTSAVGTLKQLEPGDICLIRQTSGGGKYKYGVIGIWYYRGKKDVENEPQPQWKPADGWKYKIFMEPLVREFAEPFDEDFSKPVKGQLRHKESTKVPDLIQTMIQGAVRIFEDPALSKRYLKAILKEKKKATDVEAEYEGVKGRIRRVHVYEFLSQLVATGSIQPSKKTEKEKQIDYFILQTGAEQYEDQPRKRYHFKKGIPGSKQLRKPDIAKFVYYSDGEFYAKGEIREVEKDQRGEVTHFYGVVENFREFPRRISLEEVRGQLSTEYPTQFGITKIDKREYETLLQAADMPSPSQEIPKKFYEPLEISLDHLFDEAENLIFPEEESARLKRDITAALNAGQHILFFGPPGTGKTELARLICKKVAKKIDFVDDFLMTTATADWTTFNTIGGYMPSEQGDQLQFTPGQFLRCFRSGPRQRKFVNKWLLIDELNRANIDKAFGQLLTVLSGQSIELPFVYLKKGRKEKLVNIQALNPLAGEKRRDDLEENYYYIPVSWRILSTINTYDKASLYEMSYAFMRRFAFIQVRAPKENEIEDLMDRYLEAWDLQDLISQETRRRVEEIWKRINKTPKTGVPRQIGPAIIKDLLHYLQKGGSLVQGLIAYVLPQFEGIKESAKKVNGLLSFFEEEEKEKAMAKLKHAAVDLLQIPLEKLEEV